MAQVEIKLIVSILPEPGHTLDEMATAGTDMASFGIMEVGTLVDARWRELAGDELVAVDDYA